MQPRRCIAGGGDRGDGPLAQMAGLGQAVPAEVRLRAHSVAVDSSGCAADAAGASSLSCWGQTNHPSLRGPQAVHEPAPGHPARHPHRGGLGGRCRWGAPTGLAALLDAWGCRQGSLPSGWMVARVFGVGWVRVFRRTAPCRPRNSQLILSCAWQGVHRAVKAHSACSTRTHKPPRLQ